MSAVRGKVCVVTGAGSGIGRALAHGLVARGARAVAISDVVPESLERVAGELQGRGTEIHAERLDVADRAAVAAYAQAAPERFGVVHQLYNNAGVAGGSRTTLDADYADYERVLGINLWGVVHGTLEFLPHLVASGDGHLINVSSLNGFLAQPQLGSYCTAKFAVRGFTETVRSEMLRDRKPVRVTVVHPGGVRTDIATNALRHGLETEGREATAAEQARAKLYNEKLLKLPADDAARIILDGVEKNRPRVRVGSDAKAVDLLVRLLPAQAPRLAALLDRRLVR